MARTRLPRSFTASLKTSQIIGMKAAGYSGTPLAKKLGIKSGFHIMLVNTPEYYLQLFTDLPAELYFESKESSKIDFIHFFI